MQLNNARLSFPSLFHPELFAGENPRYQAVFVFEPNSPEIERLQAEINRVAIEKWPNGAPQGLETFLHPNANKAATAGFDEGGWYFNGRSKTALMLVDQNAQTLTERDGKFYPGCYVNVMIDIYAFVKKGFKSRICCTLRGVQFAMDGDPFGASAEPITPFGVLPNAVPAAEPQGATDPDSFATQAAVPASVAASLFAT